MQTNSAKFILRLLDSLKSNEYKIAVIDQNGQRQTTYKELFTNACRVAGYLQQKKYPPHSFIGISLPTSMEYVASEIGIWLAGHAIVPMGDKYPKDRIEYIMHHCESPLLIDKFLIDDILTTSPIQDYTIQDEDEISSIFYTSGSTGHPKGVIHTFASFRIPPSAESIIEEEGISTMGITAPMYFIACKLLYAILLRGGKADLVPATTIRDIRLFEDYVDKHQIEFIFIPPSVLPHFHNHSKALKVVLAASERLSDAAPCGYKIFNQYGLTETGGSIFSFTVDKAYNNTPIGRPETDVEYCILNEKGEEARINEEGELCVKGKFSVGYYKDSASTEHLYREGWLHTGDIVRQLPDGNLLYVNRKDWIVKINGQRVEPGEVEAVIKQMDCIEDTVVKGFTSPNGQQYLCAYYVAQKEQKGETLRKHLLSQLPEYMVPAYFVQLDSIPKNANGKTNRKDLVSPVSSEVLVCQQDYEMPTNETEEELCEAFETVLGIKRIGVNDDFFSLGGDSIRVMKLQTLCPDLPLSADIIFTYLTPRKIAEACQNIVQAPLEQQEDYPLSQTQLGIFAACMSRQGETSYNNSLLFHLGQNIDLQQLAHACEAMIAAHPYVKTRLFLDNKGNPRQKRLDSESYQQSIEHVSEEEFKALRPQLLQPFNLLEDRLFRIRLFKTEKNAYLFLDFHHLIFDGVSFQILLSDLDAAYDGKPLLAEEWSSFEVAKNEESLRQTESFKEAEKWNKEQFGQLDLESLPLPNLHGNDITYGHQQQTCTFKYSDLEKACKRMSITPNVLTTAAFGYMLGSLNYADEALFATIYNGRKTLKTSHTVGMLVKTLAVHSQWEPTTTLREYLSESKAQLIGSMRNDLYSFAELSAYNSHVNSNILFAYQDELLNIDAIGGVKAVQLPVMDNATGEKFAVEIIREKEQLTIRAEYHSNLYSEAYITSVLQCYHQILTGFIHTEANKPLCSINILPDEEEKKLLSLGSGKEIQYDVNETFIDMFNRQVRLHPDSVAVVDKHGTITYAELDRQSNLLAASLIKAGVTHDTFVGIMLPRRKEFLVAMLAVFKSGGAYIPLDPDYPIARLQYFVKDSQAHLIITKSTFASKQIYERNAEKADMILMDQFDFNAKANPVNQSKPSSLAYMIYTSGSTGKSKGVMVEHQGLRAMLEWLVQLEQLTPGERCAEFASFSFDASVLDLCTPLVCGCEEHLLPASILKDPEMLYDYFNRQHIVGTSISTQMGMILLNNFDLKLRYIVMGGEKLYKTRRSPVKVINQYGPTEFTVCSAYHIVDQEKNYDNIPIGRPVPNTLSAIVSTSGKLIPRGAIGELCLIGRQIARGYWKKKEQTKKKFTTCTFKPGNMMFHTGDLVSWNNDGELEFHGRIDNQVKLHGFRIELEEIERKICAVKGVTSAIAVVHNHNGVQSLAAYYCAKKPINANTIRYHLDKQLPYYMVPQMLQQIDEMPLTPNGKIDRKKFSNPPAADDQQPTEITLPITKGEEILYELAKKLFATERFGVTDDLTMYGLTSLAAIKLSMMAKEKGKTVKVYDILRHRNIRAIAAENASVGFWDDYNPEKPVIIVIQGMTSYSQLSPLLNALRQDCSVFVIEPLEEHFSHLLGQEMTTEAYYVSLIESALPEQSVIHAIVGHSFGGALAYQCAQEWHKKTGQLPKVCMLDTYCKAAERKDLKDMLHKQEMSTLISAISSFQPYAGQLVFFKAENKDNVQDGMPHNDISDDTFRKMKEENEEAWRELVPNVTIYPVEAGHFTMLSKPDMAFYTEKITQ